MVLNNRNAYSVRNFTTWFLRKGWLTFTATARTEAILRTPQKWCCWYRFSEFTQLKTLTEDDKFPSSQILNAVFSVFCLHVSCSQNVVVHYHFIVNSVFYNFLRYFSLFTGVRLREALPLLRWKTKQHLNGFNLNSYFRNCFVNWP